MFMKAIYLGKGDHGLQTGVVAEFESAEETKASFEQIKPHAEDIKTAAFLIDLHDDDGIIDTVAVSEETYSLVTGELVLSEAEYRQIDDNYWGRG